MSATKVGPANSITDAETGSRWYIHPVTGERFISVTTVLGNVAKYGLPAWSAKLTAEAAMTRAEWIAGIAANGIDDCHAGSFEDQCGHCWACAISWLSNRHNEVRDQAGSIGTRMHDAAEQHSLFGPGASVDEEVKPFVDGYLRWVDAWKPEFSATEMTVINRDYGYAGTLDAILTLPFAELLPDQFKPLAGGPLVLDYKTSRQMDICKGWQVVAYSKAQTILLPDGSEQPMPEIKGGLILHIRPGQVQVRQVHCTFANFAYFINLLRVAEGLAAGLNTVLSRPFTLKEN